MILKSSISLVIPCFNEEKGITKVLSEIPSYIDEVIVVDNNSTDKTAQKAKKQGATVIKENKQGYGAAIKKGIYHATSDLIGVLDGDGTYQPKEFKRFVEIMKKDNIDFISGNRFNKRYKNSMPIINLTGNIILTFVTRLLFTHPIQDSQSGMFLFKRSVLSSLDPQSDSMSFSEEIKIKAVRNKKIRFKEMPIDYHDNRRLGKKKLNLWKDGIGNIIFLLKMKLG